MNLNYLLTSIQNKILRKIFRNNCQKYAETLGVKFGKGCFVSTKEFPGEGYLIEIGNYVRIASHASFYTHGGLWSIRKFYNDNDLEHFGKIKIGNYTSIGSYAMIMPGVTIGERCIIAGGAVVTKSVPDGCMVAGNPAKFIGYTDDFYRKVKENNDFACKGMSAEEKKDFLLSQPDDKFINKGYIKVPEK